jgi:purine-nucleoside phosphorylase
VILGTGLGGLAGRLTAAWSLPAAKTGWLAASTATGHAGRIACGTLYGTRVVALEGRVHGYEGRSAETLIRGVELLAALGVETLLITNAAGGLRPDMRVGEIVVVSDHVDFVRGDWTAPLAAGEDGADGADGAGPPARGCYDDAAAEVAVAALAAAGAPARRGMSTVPEVAAAAALGMRVVVCSVVTNVANPDAPGTTDAEDVCRMAAGAGDGVWAVLGALARRAAGVPTCGSC